jgi:hypothetical protein
MSSIFVGRETGDIDAIGVDVIFAVAVAVAVGSGVIGGLVDGIGVGVGETLSD